MISRENITVDSSTVCLSDYYARLRLLVICCITIRARVSVRGPCLTSDRTRVSRVLSNNGDDTQLYQLYHHVCLCHPDLDPEEDWCRVHQDDCQTPGPNIHDCEYNISFLRDEVILYKLHSG